MLYGFSSLEKQLISNLKENKLHHCNLILGKKGIGKRKFAMDMAATILSDGFRVVENRSKNLELSNLFANYSSEESDIDENYSARQLTQKLIASGGHSDLLILDINTLDDEGKENQSKKGEINVKQVRRVIGELKLTPSLSRNKVLIVDSLNNLNPNGQNALLKTLEEPTANTYIFLLCHDINTVLETIKSRSNIISVLDLSMEDWTRALEDSGKKMDRENDLVELYEISDHSVGTAITIINNDMLKLFHNLEDIILKKEKDMLKIHELADVVTSGSNETFNLFKLIFDKFFERLLTIYDHKNVFGKDGLPKKYEDLINSHPTTLVENYERGLKLLNDVETYNLDKKHALVVLLNGINLFG